MGDSERETEKKIEERKRGREEEKREDKGGKTLRTKRKYFLFHATDI